MLAEAQEIVSGKRTADKGELLRLVDELRQVAADALQSKEAAAEVSSTELRFKEKIRDLQQRLDRQSQMVEKLRSELGAASGKK